MNQEEHDLHMMKVKREEFHVERDALSLWQVGNTLNHSVYGQILIIGTSRGFHVPSQREVHSATIITSEGKMVVDIEEEDQQIQLVGAA